MRHDHRQWPGFLCLCLLHVRSRPFLPDMKLDGRPPDASPVTARGKVANARPLRH